MPRGVSAADGYDKRSKRDSIDGRPGTAASSGVFFYWVAKPVRESDMIVSPKGGDSGMKKLLTVTLVLVFALALVLAIGCSKKEQTSSEGTNMEQGQTQQAAPADTMNMGGAPATTDTTATGH